MVEEMPGNANMSDAMLALSDETQKYLVMLNSAECMLTLSYMGMSVCLCVCCVLPSVACYI